MIVSQKTQKNKKIQKFQKKNLKFKNLIFFLLEFEDSKILQNGLWPLKSEPSSRSAHFDILYIFFTSYAKVLAILLFYNTFFAKHVEIYVF